MTDLRITHYDQVDPATLQPNPLNARIHPPAQQQALVALLEAVGWVRHIIVNTRTGYVLNGHLRLAQALENDVQQVPVAYVDLDGEEERLLLALFDAVGGLAVTDAPALGALLETARAEAPALEALLNQLAHQAGLNLTLPEWSDDDPEAIPADVAATLGELHLTIDRATFERWREQLYQTVGFDEEAIILEIRRRLRL